MSNTFKFGNMVGALNFYKAKELLKQEYQKELEELNEKIVLLINESEIAQKTRNNAIETGITPAEKAKYTKRITIIENKIKGFQADIEKLEDAYVKNKERHERQYQIAERKKRAAKAVPKASARRKTRKLKNTNLRNSLANYARNYYSKARRGSRSRSRGSRSRGSRSRGSRSRGSRSRGSRSRGSHSRSRSRGSNNLNNLVGKLSTFKFGEKPPV